MAKPASPEVVGQVLSLPIADIEIGERLRPIDPVWAAALGKVIKAEGQDDPIKVCRLPGKTGWRLVVGGHRITGMAGAGFSHIDAIQVDAEAVGRLMKEISENLWRKGLSPIDRAAFVAELVRLKKVQAGIDPAKAGRSVSAQKRWQEVLDDDAADATDTMSVAYGWSAEVGEQVGLNERTIRRDLELHRRLLPDVVEQLRGHPIADNAGQLRQLAKMTEADQRQAVAMILAGTAKTPADAAATLNQKPLPDDGKKAWNAFFGAWGRMSAAKRKDALRELALRGLPAGVSLSIVDREAA